jgi:hypothetical protein
MGSWTMIHGHGNDIYQILLSVLHFYLVESVNVSDVLVNVIRLTLVQSVHIKWLPL